MERWEPSGVNRNEVELQMAQRQIGCRDDQLIP